MELKEIIREAECGWCHKTKEVVQVAFSNGKSTTLCWKDLQRMAAIELTGKAPAAPKPESNA